MPDLAVRKMRRVRQLYAKIYITGNDMWLSHVIHSQQVR